MTRRRLFLPLFTAACGAVLLALAGGPSAAAPVPKGASQNEPTPDLKAFFDTVGKAVKDEKWPAEADEKKLRETAQKIFERTLKAAEANERKLPVDFGKLKKLDVTKERKNQDLDGNFLIAGDVRTTVARNSIIFAAGNVQLTGADNCLIIAQNVRCTGVDNCLIIAGDFIRLTSARRSKDSGPSILVAGQWIRTTTMDGTICHVIRPTGLPSPDEQPGGNMPYPAIGTNGAKGVIYLNERADTAGEPGQTYLPQKTPIAK